mmetsp:Transcript_9892/g.26075  ORF Transcript_9892/g.26075 Transcript_9892/m.26075 type:complete len:209 (+) Transcript_9892:1204-1830(+)
MKIRSSVPSSIFPTSTQIDWCMAAERRKAACPLPRCPVISITRSCGVPIHRKSSMNSDLRPRQKSATRPLRSAKSPRKPPVASRHCALARTNAINKEPESPSGKDGRRPRAAPDNSSPPRSSLKFAIATRTCTEAIRSGSQITYVMPTITNEKKGMAYLALLVSVDHNSFWMYASNSICKRGSSFSPSAAMPSFPRCKQFRAATAAPV